MNFQEFKEKYEHKPVEEYPNNVVENPVVSVCVQTYQHAPYIKECLDGILMQKTDFPFEILLGEDGSNDGTREICIEYAKKYPDKIRLFLHHRENNIEINGNPTGRFNFLYNLFSARGKYIALCEGDDYWTDPLKLQKQVDFLEKYSEGGLIYSKAIRLNNETKNKELIGPPPQSQGLLFKKYSIPTVTTLFTKELFLKYQEEIKPEGKNWKMGDYPIWLWFEFNSEIYYLPEVMATYRVLNESASHTKDKNKRFLFFVHGFDVASFFAKKYLKKDDYESFVLDRMLILYKNTLIKNLKYNRYYKKKLLKMNKTGWDVKVIVQLIDIFKLNKLVHKLFLIKNGK